MQTMTTPKKQSVCSLMCVTLSTTCNLQLPTLEFPTCGSRVLSRTCVERWRQLFPLIRFADGDPANHNKYVVHKVCGATFIVQPAIHICRHRPAHTHALYWHTTGGRDYARGRAGRRNARADRCRAPYRSVRYEHG
jgi:hypothetical protein